MHNQTEVVVNRQVINFTEIESCASLVSESSHKSRQKSKKCFSQFELQNDQIDSSVSYNQTIATIH